MSDFWPISRCYVRHLHLTNDNDIQLVAGPRVCNAVCHRSMYLRVAMYFYLGVSRQRYIVTVYDFFYLHSTEYAVARCLSVSLSVTLSVTRRSGVKTAKHGLIIKLFLPHHSSFFLYRILRQCSRREPP